MYVNIMFIYIRDFLFSDVAYPYDFFEYNLT